MLVQQRIASRIRTYAVYIAAHDGIFRCTDTCNIPITCVHVQPSS